MEMHRAGLFEVEDEGLGLKRGRDEKAIMN
jgi:hypothetical protein